MKDTSHTSTFFCRILKHSTVRCRANVHVERNEPKADINLVWHGPCNPEEPMVINVKGERGIKLKGRHLCWAAPEVDPETGVNASRLRGS